MNNLAMQFQSDILRVPVITSTIMEATALGAAFAAGRTIDYWGKDLGELWSQGNCWKPKMELNQVNILLANWQKGIVKSKNWVEQVDQVECDGSQSNQNKVKDKNCLLESISWMALGASIAVATTLILKRI